MNAGVAQLVERRTENPYVVSSILTAGNFSPNCLGLFLCLLSLTFSSFVIFFTLPCLTF